MTRYRDLSGNSGVVAYRIGTDHIAVEFRSGDMYLYTYHKPGKVAVEDMKRLAEAGRGLSTYISQHVRDDYEARI
ncbi:hypothetical protein LLH06_16545 [Mucilaginibacter daejeonensis]|uniref:hypothetical protein n=1 Tax=Mucilaginibacter daejeonensis TaxID=398049 RepID=UPI001D1716DA|nr:hypothetical protein [Mucilaginibacter daejeonensis]UEG52566.1 hypothetical protein LLH06_16545 [Mucilaginibacter daejeonensis]